MLIIDNPSEKVLNSEHVVDGLTRDIALTLQVGDKQLWSAIETVTIEGTKEVDDPGTAPESVVVNNFFF